MLVTPLPGVDREHLLQTLRELDTAVSNLYTAGSGSAHDRLTAYLEWTTTAEQHLGNQITRADLDRLVFTPGYGRLLSVAGRLTSPDVPTQRALNGMVSMELRQRTDTFEAACRDLAARRWPGLATFIVADTSVYIESRDKLRDLDFTPLVDPDWPINPIWIFVPIAVVDELDGLKRSGAAHVRWRAGYTVAVLDEVCPGPNGPGQLRAADAATGRGEVIMEILLDPPGHVRLPITDDEIIDRALSVQPLTRRPVKLLTFDTGMSMRARAAGLAVTKLTKLIGDEPSGKSQ